MNHTLCVLLSFFFRVADLSTCSRVSGATSKHGELIGGSDIALEMLNDDSLREMFDAGRQA